MKYFTVDNMLLALVPAALIVGGILLLRYLSYLEKVRKKRQTNSEQPEVATPGNVDSSQIKKQRLDNIEKRFSITRRSLYSLMIILVVMIIIVPIIISISPTLLSVVIACVSVVVGIAAKPLIENLICGLVLCFGKLARIGDVVLVDSEYGTIEDVTLTHCIVRRWDWLRYVVPNSVMMTKEFINYSLHDNYRWVHVEFWVDHRADLKLVEKIAIDSPKQSQYYSGSEEPKLWIVDITPQSVKCMVVAWATSAADGWMLSIDIRKQILIQFQEHNIKTHLENIRLEDFKVLDQKETAD